MVSLAYVDQSPIRREESRWRGGEGGEIAGRPSHERPAQAQRIRDAPENQVRVGLARGFLDDSPEQHVANIRVRPVRSGLEEQPLLEGLGGKPLERPGFRW